MSDKSARSANRTLYVVGGLLLLVVLAGVGAWWTGIFARDEGVQVEVAEAEKRDVTQVVTASGKLQPEVDVLISPDVSGEVIFLGVEEGDYVEKGTQLVGIKPDFYEAQVQQAEAGLAQARASEQQAKAQLLQAENDYQRQKTLFERDVIPEQEYQDAETGLEVARAQHKSAQYQVQSAEARLREVREQLDKTQIFAPMSGTVSQLNIEVGERVVGTEQMAGTEIMQIAQLDRMEVEIDVNENDVVNVAMGDSAHIEVDAYPDRYFEGVVTGIANSARTSNAGTQEQVTNFPVKVRIAKTPPGSTAAGSSGSSAAGGVRAREAPTGAASFVNFRPGMSATVDVYTETAFEAVAVPIQAVTVRDFADSLETTAAGALGAPESRLREVVFVMDDGTARRQPVTTGISDDTHIELITGISPGETVITGPYSAVSRELADGTQVRTGAQDGPVRQ